MAAPYYVAIPGEFVLIGKEPDGDSVRFVPDDPSHFNELGNSYRIQPTRTDGSVQLRFEAVDATELHYGTASQPMAASSRDAVLTRLGFTNVQFKPNSTTVIACQPERTSGVILSKAADVHGRPISYVLPGKTPAGVHEGQWNYASHAILRRTVNFDILEQGLAFYTVYNSTPAQHRGFLSEIAAAARNASQGVWAENATADFVLDTQADIGPDGAVILPKLFRRCTDYLKAKQQGFVGELADWLRANATGPRQEDDQVHLVSANATVRLSSLIEQHNNHISLKADLLDIIFIAK
jgi:endonuclease YncB( thermonuclease family)